MSVSKSALWRVLLLAVAEGFSAVIGPMISIASLTQAQPHGVDSSRSVFEVASVKVSRAAVHNWDGGPGTHDPGRFLVTGGSMRGLLGRAYALEDYQQQVSGPSWIDSETYDIVAKVPGGTTREQFREMLRSLLVERFRLVVHLDTKLLPVYELVLENSGPKMKESVDVSKPADSETSRPSGIDKEGFPILPEGTTGLFSSFGPGPRSHWIARQQTMSDFVMRLRQPLATGRLVIDKTGLTKKYDFTLEYDIQRPNSEPSGVGDDSFGVSIFDAVRKQLGLRLADTKAAFDLVVIDHVERIPTEN